MEKQITITDLSKVLYLSDEIAIVNTKGMTNEESKIIYDAFHRKYNVVEVESCINVLLFTEVN